MTFSNRYPRTLGQAPNVSYRSFWQYIHVDILLLTGILLLIGLGLVILYSASTNKVAVIENQILRIGISLVVMFIFAQIPPIVYQRWAFLLYIVGVVLLIAVLIGGHIGKGAERWLNLGIIRVQPSEMMKLAIPMFLAAYFHKIHLPLTLKSIAYAALIIFIPAILAAKQPDFGTAIILIVAGASVLLLAGLSWSLIATLIGLGMLSAPFVWYLLHDYQRQRVLTFLNPEHDPLGSGYHIIQSKIAIGSGGFFGKGWLNGTQSHLQFLPEHSTDFIFAVCSEEFGFMGNIILIALYMSIILRGLYITINAQDTFSRLLAGSLTLTFFVSFFINMGMVTGILPVVGLPLPLVSYGGSSMVTLMASFGILMSIQTHRKLLTT
ncbi:MAG TPA: rod shape-determining protein RodA [Gammaproteobacteria bacterium]|jgi:rod shape determining protein RodA|nr:rod shape-determining protein RodA [Gammaproteobacteria bacterium]